MRCIATTLAAVFVGLGLWTTHRAAAQETVIHSFLGTDGSGGGGLLMNAKGELFGAAPGGGTYDNGTVFELAPAAGGGWSETVLYSFGSNEGFPSSSLVSDGNGNLYGTTYAGGPARDGIVFELSPTAAGTWTEKTIYNFGSYATDGIGPGGALAFDGLGHLYGTTSYGGVNYRGPNSESGTVFELQPSSNGTWIERVLYSFKATGTDGFGPEGGVVIDHAGNLYGTTYLGGDGGAGTVFEVSPQAGGTWTEKILHNFSTSYSPLDGWAPTGNLILDGEGNLFGTTSGAGDSYFGTVFELSPGAGGTWTEDLYVFEDAASGAYPYGGLQIDAAGKLYGATSFGGVYDPDAYDYYGTVFSLQHKPGGGWTETVLHSFPASAGDGNWVFGGVLLGSKGNLYGTTEAGGAANAGTVFEIKGAAVATPAATTTSLVVSPSGELAAGEPITLTATVAPTSGPAVPGGTVTFSDPSIPGESLAVLVVDGVATYHGRVPPMGSYSGLALYSGDAIFAPSKSATVSRIVTAAKE